jgi:molecular chaperone DnaK (HSP70)
MEVRAVAGDNFLGGEDFTEVLIGMFLAHHGINPDRLSPRHAAALYKSAETAKLAFSKSKQVTMRVSLPAGMIRREVTDLNETTAGEPAVPLPAEDFTDQAADGFTGRAAEEPARLRSLDEPLRKIVNPDETAADEPVCHTADKAADPLPEDNESNCLLEMELTLSEYEKRCEIVLARLKAPVVRALSDASVRLSDVDAIVLVGGATKLPIVRSFVSKLFGRIPSVGIDPDEAVALGAAVQAAMKERHAYIKELLLTDVCPYTLGTDVAIKRPDGLLESGNFAPIIERNSIIPASRVERFYTVRDNQRAVDIDILQGENRKAKDNIFLGSLKIPLPAGPAGSEAVDVRYTYDINGILEVEVTSVSSGKVEKKIIEKNPGAMSQDEIQGRFKDLSSLKIHPRENDAYKYLLEKGERLYQEHTGDKRQMIANAIQNFETALDKQERSAINAAAEALRELFSQVEEFEL